MKTSEARTNNFVCPACKKKLCQDREERGYVRHLERMDDGTLCQYGRKEKD
jgi:hypothetical protein